MCICVQIKQKNVKKIQFEVGKFDDTFRANYKRIPLTLKEKLTPSELAELTEAFYECYGDGKNER